MKTKEQFKTTTAYVAYVMKIELKAKFPNVKFSVRSETFSGGDSITASYDITPENLEFTKHIKKEVEQIVKKYEGGKFDGMSDIYEYDYTKKYDTAKYTFLNVNVDKTVHNKYAYEVIKEYPVEVTDYYGGYIYPKKYDDRYYFNKMLNEKFL